MAGWTKMPLPWIRRSLPPITKQHICCICCRGSISCSWLGRGMSASGIPRRSNCSLARAMDGRIMNRHYGSLIHANAIPYALHTTASSLQSKGTLSTRISLAFPRVIATLLPMLRLFTSCTLLRPPCVADADIIFSSCSFFFLLLFFLA